MEDINDWVNVYDLKQFYLENFPFDKGDVRFSMNDIFNNLSNLTKIKIKTKRKLVMFMEDYNAEN